jgi:hypothetical protein
MTQPLKFIFQSGGGSNRMTVNTLNYSMHDTSLQACIMPGLYRKQNALSRRLTAAKTVSPYPVYSLETRNKTIPSGKRKNGKIPPKHGRVFTEPLSS